MTSNPITYAALLRGINVGGNTIVSMTELKACIEKLGYTEIKTYINSGNVIFHTDTLDPRAIEIEIEKALAATFGYRIVVVVRSFKAMKRIVKNTPPSWQTGSDLKCNVIFLRHTIDSPTVLGSLKPRPGIEELYYQPGVLFWSAKTSDLAKSTMLKLNGAAVCKEMTVRNLNTTRKIYELMTKSREDSMDMAI